MIEVTVRKFSKARPRPRHRCNEKPSWEPRGAEERPSGFGGPFPQLPGSAWGLGSRAPPSAGVDIDLSLQPGACCASWGDRALPGLGGGFPSVRLALASSRIPGQDDRSSSLMGPRLPALLIVVLAGRLLPARGCIMCDPSVREMLDHLEKTYLPGHLETQYHEDFMTRVKQALEDFKDLPIDEDAYMGVIGEGSADSRVPGTSGGLSGAGKNTTRKKPSGSCRRERLGCKIWEVPQDWQVCSTIPSAGELLK